MIHRIFSNLPTFKGLDFKPGLKVLIAQKERGANDKQTRNRAGKTSLIEIIHFLAGADAGKDSLFRSDISMKFTYQNVTLRLRSQSVMSHLPRMDR